MRQIVNLLIVAVITVVCTTGCRVNNRLVWAPDGKSALVLGGDGLRLADPSGELSGPLLQGVECAAWLPDSRRIVASVAVPAKDWAEFSAATSPETREQILSSAKRLKEEILAYTGKWEDFGEKNHAISELPRVAEAIAYLRETAAAELKPKLKDNWKFFEESRFQVRQVRLLDYVNGNMNVLSTVYSTIDTVADLRVSPLGNACTIVEDDRPDDDLSPYLLLIAGLGGEKALKLSDRASRFPDWTRDGKSVVYVRAQRSGRFDADKEPSPGEVIAAGVTIGSGGIAAPASEEKRLAMCVFSLRSRVRCLKNGGIVFSSRELSLPCTINDISDSEMLYGIQPGSQSTAIRLVPRGAESDVGDRAMYFEISPDDRYASLPDHSGNLTVLKLATGEVLSASHNGFASDKGLKFVPQWRNAEEVCFAADVRGSRKDDTETEVVLWSPEGKSGRAISSRWPAAAVKGLLD